MKLNKSFLKANKASIAYLLIIGILPLLASSSLLFYAYKFEIFLQNLPWNYWVLIYSLACISMALALTPTTLIALLSGYFLGWWGLLGIGIAYPIASWIGYTLAYWIDKGKFLQSIQHVKHVPQILAALKQKEFNIIFLVRLSPVLPFALMNVFLSMAKVNLQRFLIASFLGMLPRTCLAIWIGMKAYSLTQLTNKDNLTEEIIIGLLILISIGGLLKYIQKAIRQVWIKTNQNESL